MDGWRKIFLAIRLREDGEERIRSTRIGGRHVSFKDSHATKRHSFEAKSAKKNKSSTFNDRNQAERLRCGWIRKKREKTASESLFCVRRPTHIVIGAQINVDKPTGCQSSCPPNCSLDPFHIPSIPVFLSRQSRGQLVYV